MPGIVRTIDTMHQGRARVIAAHLVGDLIVDPGPASALGNWIDDLAVEPRALLLTHIHLDHAGATGVLARRFPGLRVFVSEVGAPHLVDPAKLLKSAARLYGPDNMRSLWGEVAPVPEDRIEALAGGEVVEGFRVEHVPGHAKHHVCWFHLDSGDAYVGDMAGVRIPPSELTLAPTPPPDVDIEAWLDSIERIEAIGPERLRMTHFGVCEDVGEQFERVREALRRSVELGERGRDAFLDGFQAEVRERADAETAAAMIQATPLEQQWLGIERYLQQTARS